MMSVGRSRGATIPKHVLFGVTALTMILIYIAYKTGESMKFNNSKSLMITTQLKESSIQSDITACEEKLTIIQKNISSPIVNELKEEVSKLVIRNKNAFNRLQEYRNSMAICEKRLEIQEQSSQANKEDLKTLIEEKRTLEELQNTLNRLTDGRGARMTLSLGAIRNLRTSYRNINKYIGRVVSQEPENIKQLEAELLAKWNNKIQQNVIEGKTAQLYATENITKMWQFFNISEVLERSQKDANNNNNSLPNASPTTSTPLQSIDVKSHNISIKIPVLPPKSLFLINSKATNASIFFVGAEALDGSPIRPSWNGNVMQQPIQSFRTPETSAVTVIPQNSVASLMISLYDAVMCGVSKDTIVSVPNAFHWISPTAKKQSPSGNNNNNNKSSLVPLVDILDCPLLTLCEGCQYVLDKKLFQMACGVQPSMINYGSREFWVARSRLRFSSKVYEVAELFLEEHNIDGEVPFLSVVYHASNAVDVDCSSSSSSSSRGSDNNAVMTYLRHRLWIARNYGINAVRHINPNNYDSQCAPSVTDVKNGILRMLQDMKFEGLTITVYVSLPVEYIDMLEGLKMEGIKIITRNINSAQDEAVDAVIASRARNILVSSFFKHSQLVTEMYLLHSRFDQSGVYFF